MMTFTQWLLFNLAGEASELAKEATKAGQFGLEGLFGGKSNLEHIHDEFIDVIGVVELLASLDPVAEIAKPIGKLGLRQNEVNGHLQQRIWKKSFKVSYFAHYAIMENIMMPTSEEFEVMHRCALQWHERYHDYKNEEARIFAEGLLKGVASKVTAYHAGK